ncbi:hypothetical protein [Xylophilus ampelinus]|uniref:Uncharacterized protein n=1 Tax=Xylophilus ampelinus TaxID=54067 RepID=A0A318SWV6_9BURK|nr:hypothetical protein [Xylophilus ampelinus]MCS4508737.1 hypothetical protein [Xylophilus ampelinus]PYE79307.1 hypothetical protein DFQ15_10237 [Xylophilus ampelinus]
MPLHPVIQAGAPRLAVAAQTYRQNFLSVNAAIAGVAASALPVLQNTPANWDDFTSTYLEAQTQAVSWFDGIASKFGSLPAFIVANGPLVAATLSSAAGDASTLEASPGDLQALSDLNEKLGLAIAQIDQVSQFVAASLSAIESFDSGLPALTASLQQLVADFMAAEAADQAQVDALTAAVQVLDNDIKSLQNNIMFETTATKATLWIARFTPAWNPPFLALKFFLVGISAAAQYVIDLDTLDITNDLAKIAVEQSQISGLAADAAACKLQVTAYQNVSTAIIAAVGSAGDLASVWQALSADLMQEAAILKQSLADGGAADFAAVASDLVAASGAWNTLEQQAMSIELDVQVNTAILQPGWSSAQVLAALAAGSTLQLSSFIDANVSAASAQKA